MEKLRQKILAIRSGRLVKWLVILVSCIVLFAMVFFGEVR